MISNLILCNLKYLNISIFNNILLYFIIFEIILFHIVMLFFNEFMFRNDDFIGLCNIFFTCWCVVKFFFKMIIGIFMWCFLLIAHYLV